MIVDVLLPSEIARLVYGYLLEEKCTETAKSFLNESPNLEECRNLLKCGRTIPSRVGGYALLNMLETFCSINSIVQDQLSGYDSTHKIRKCMDIVTQIKFLLEDCRSTEAINSRNETVQSANKVATPLKVHKKCQSGKHENGSNVVIQSDEGYQTETPPDSNSMHNTPSVEATPLEHLPGYVESLHDKKCETSHPTTIKTSTKITNKLTQSQLEPELITNSIHKVQIENFKRTEENTNKLNTVISQINSEAKLSHFSHPENVVETNLCNNLISGNNQEVINLDDSEGETSLESPIEIDPGNKVSEACIEILGDVQSELLNRTEIHEKIANNINKLMEPIKNSSQSQFSQGSERDGNQLLMNDINKIIGTAVDMTENDPLFIELLNSLMELDDHVSTSEEIEMDIDNENPSSEENISNEDVIILESNQCGPESIAVDSRNVATVEQNNTSIIEVGVSNDILNNSEVDESFFGKDFPAAPDFADHNTSTPLKLFTATQSYDTSEWYSTETLPSSNIAAVKKTSVGATNGHFPYTQNATEHIVNAVDGFLSPIIYKENTKIAEKISLNCSVTDKDDTLHTPDVPPTTKSFIPMMPPPVSVTNILPKNKIPDVSKNSVGKNVILNVQAVQQTAPTFNSISSLVKNTEFNRFFSIDSISVTQMENGANNVQNPAISTDIQVEDSAGLTSTGLSPFLKMNKTTTADNAESRKNENNAPSNTVGDKIEDSQALSNERIVETSLNVNEVTSKPTINLPPCDSHVQDTVIEIKDNVEVVAIDNDIYLNEEVGSITQGIIIGSGAKVDMLKDVPLEASGKTNSIVKKDVEKTLETVSRESNEANESNKEKSANVSNDINDRVNCAITKSPITNQVSSGNPIETKVQSSKKESLKSFISKAFESYIDKNKDTVPSNHTELPTRNTPKALVEERAKSKRRSLSTPKKSSSHIRFLTFETPIQSRSDSKINDKIRCASPESAKRNLKRIHESFKSPPAVQCDNQVQIVEDSSTTANVVNKKLDSENTTNVQDIEIKKQTAKKSWDSDLRILCQASDQPKVEAPKRRYKTKSKENSSTKKKKRDKSMTPRKEKKNDKDPHSKKSKKIEKQKTPKKSKKHDKSSEHKDDKSKDEKRTRTKTEDKLSTKSCKDLGALIEDNLLFNNAAGNVDEETKKVGNKFTANEGKNISAQITSNLLSSKSGRVIKKVEITANKNSSLEECKPAGEKVKNDYLMPNLNESLDLSSNESTLLPDDNLKKVQKDEQTKLFSNSPVNQQAITNFKETELNKVDTNVQEISTQRQSQEMPSVIPKILSNKDPLERLLSDSVNDDEDLSDMMELESEDAMPRNVLIQVKKPVNTDIVEKMQQDEQAIAAILKEANDAVNEKFNSKNVINQQDFFPETSLLTDGDESEAEKQDQEDIASLIDDKSSANEKLEQASISKPEELKNKSSQDNDNESEKINEKNPEISSKSSVDYESIEKQLSILTNTEVSSTRKVIYDEVKKLEHGKIVNKKYARLKTIDTKLATKSNRVPMGGYEIILDSSSSIKEDESIEMPPTPRILDPSSNSWMPSAVVKEDSRTIQTSIPTPLECPPTPKIFITPQKIEEDSVHIVPEKADAVPFYHLTPITFETSKKTEVTEFEVVKEILKKTTPKTPNKKKEEENAKKRTKTPNSSTSSYKDQSSSRLDSEDSDSSSSSDSSESSSSSSDEEDECSIQPTVPAEEKEDINETNLNLEEKLQPIVQNEEVGVGNEVMLIEHEEVVLAEEASPKKVFPIHKTDKELAETIKETPAKLENMIPEEGIFETPNVSKPVDNPTNLHAKISQIMIMKEQEEIRRLESQQKLKIVNIETVSTKIVMSKSSTISPSEEIKANIVKKSDDEVAQAIESIANEKFDESQDDLNVSRASTILPEVQPTDKLKKRELTKAIQSIIKETADEENCESSSNDDSTCDSEPQLKLILEDDVKSTFQELNGDDDESLGLDNCENSTKNTEFHVVFDEANYKKKRRTQFFTDEDMTLYPQDEDGNTFAKFAPTCVDILLNLMPAKKKTAVKKKIKEEINEKAEQEFDDGDSSEDFVPTKSTKAATKRKRSIDEPKSRKRKKNIFIY